MVTYFIPGTKVNDILVKTPSLLVKHPCLTNVVIHVGCSDVSNKTSEILNRILAESFTS